jgi:hypothetical protein
MSVVQEISCSHCGGPLQINPGEIMTTCRYCGFTQVIETGKPFNFEHSMFLNEYTIVDGSERNSSFENVSLKQRRKSSIKNVIRSWMQAGFTKPSNLGKDSKLLEMKLVYVPFWIFNVEVRSKFKGVFERITPAVVKDEKIEKSYDWLVLARRRTQFPTREYDVPLKAKIPYDFRRIEKFAQVLNSEVSEMEAMEKAKEELENLHRFLARENVDKVIDWNSEFKFGETFYLHAPIWFITYEYKKNRYQIILDGATGIVIKGDIPASDFRLI